MGAEGSDIDIDWHNPARRGILPLDTFRVPRRLKRAVRRGEFSATMNADFSAVIVNCSERTSTWINRSIITSYKQLHQAGLAHSVEVWASGQHVGGLYGVALNGAFFGESMYSRSPMASQVALIHLVDHLRRTGFRLLDIQFISSHLQRFGAQEISRRAFLNVLHDALAANSLLTSQKFEGDSVSALQRISQIS